MLVVIKLRIWPLPISNARTGPFATLMRIDVLESFNFKYLHE